MSNAVDPMHQAIQFYRSLGLNVIPIRKGEKKPALDWGIYQQRMATDEEITSWLEKGFFENLAVINGKVSGNLVTLDFEEEEKFQQFFNRENEIEDLKRRTLIHKTGGGKGIHVLLRGDRSLPADRQYHENFKLDIQGEGTYVLVPPSKTTYEYKRISEAEVILHIPDLGERISKRVEELGLQPAARLTIHDIEEGVGEGQRNDSAFRYARFLLGYWLLDEEAAWETLKKWNEKNKPPLPESELRAVFHSAKKYKSVEQWRKATFTEDIPPQIRSLAEKALESPNLLRLIKVALDETIVREQRNKLYLHLILLTGKRKEPEMKQIVALKGDPGGGKTHLANRVTKSFLTKTVARFSDTALDYSDLSNWEVLYIKELLGLERDEKMGVSGIRFLGADDEGYSVEITVGDPQTGFRTVERKIPAMTVLTTTTQLRLEKQFERRLHELNMDESPETTMKVLQYKAWKEWTRLDRLIGRVPSMLGETFLKAVTSALEDCEIQVTTPQTLLDLFDTKLLRARGDYEKVITLTKMVTWQHQRQRPWATVDHTKVIFQLPQDAYLAVRIGCDPILTMTMGMEKRLRDFLPVLDKLRRWETVLRVGKEEERLNGFLVKDFSGLVNLSDSRSRVLLNVFCERGILRFSKPRSYENVYSIAISDVDFEEKLKTSSVDKMANDFAAALQKEAAGYFSQTFNGSVPEHSLRVQPVEWLDLDRDKSLQQLLKEFDEAPEESKRPLKQFKAQGPQLSLEEDEEGERISRRREKTEDSLCSETTDLRVVDKAGSTSTRQEEQETFAISPTANDSAVIELKCDYCGESPATKMRHRTEKFLVAICANCLRKPRLAGFFKEAS